MTNVPEHNPNTQRMALAAMAKRRNVSPREMMQRFLEKKITNSMRLEFLQEIYRAADQLKSQRPQEKPKVDEMKIKRWLVLGVFVLSFLLASMLGFYVG